MSCKTSPSNYGKFTMAQIDKLQKAKDEFFDDMVKAMEITGAFDEMEESEKAERIAEIRSNEEMLDAPTHNNQTLRKWCECIEDIEYADEEIIAGLIELMEEFCSTMKQELKERFATMKREERLGGVAIIKFVEKLVDILQNGRYIEIEEPEEETQENVEKSPQESADELPELMSERIALCFEELREFVRLAELDKQIKELHTLKGKMQEALNELIAEIFEN